MNKPTGLLSLSGKNPLNKDSVHYRLVQDYPTATMVHRLDFGTSGLMVVALNKAVNGELTKQFQERSVVKNYIATLLGHLADDEGVIDAPIAKADFPRQKVCHANQASLHKLITKSLSARSPPCTRQILPRCSLHRLLGAPTSCECIVVKLAIQLLVAICMASTIGGMNSQLLAGRLMLHASSLSFNHPVSCQRIRTTSNQQFY